MKLKMRSLSLKHKIHVNVKRSCLLDYAMMGFPHVEISARRHIASVYYLRYVTTRNSIHTYKKRCISSSLLEHIKK